ncbi:unnamed protein product [Candidula unifasciata]|uniref:Rho-GAP domain-containing protein n=1 Tax=Candidula unifasciata TaxID=100452 RepID=A0A8S3Z438_9EUPU|nr:unnamed protein product [Candidula unifasciata]
MAFPNRELEDYWNEFRNIETDHHSDDDELSKTPDEGEVDAEWLDAAGFSFVVSKFQETPCHMSLYHRAAFLSNYCHCDVTCLVQTDGRDLSDDELETMTDTLTQVQAEAVRKRISALSTTMRRKHKGSKVHVKDIFTTSSDPRQTHPVESHLPDPHRVELPAFEPKLDPLGVTLIGDLAECDMWRVKALAHIELTALFDEYNIMYSRAKRRKKVKDHGIFGVPLDILVERDQKRTPGTKVPVVFQVMINFLEKEGLRTEGILRMSGAETRVKQLRQDLEEKFYQGLFSWGDAGPHDVAVLLKQFLRELPAPLLSYSYLEAFPQISSIPKILEQLKALNLLILLLPNEHRNTLKVLLQFLRNVVSQSNYNKMGLKNVAMIMAPNLFLAPSSGNKDKEKINLELELKKAAETSTIVKMLVHYQDVLWTIPPSFIAQIRYQYALEYHRKNRTSKLPWRKDKDRSDIFKRYPVTSDPYDHQDGVIRVQAPHLTKSSTLIQLDRNTTAADVVAKFKLGDDSLRTDKDGHRTIGKVEETNGHTYRNPNNAQYAHDSDYLYEVGGNISERCLDPRTKVLDLYHVNPLADWVIKKREGRPQIYFHIAH